MKIFNFFFFFLNIVESLPLLIHSLFPLFFTQLPLCSPPRVSTSLGGTTFSLPLSLAHLSWLTFFLRLPKYFLYSHIHWQVTSSFLLPPGNHLLNRRREDKNRLFLILLSIWGLTSSVAAGDALLHAGSEEHQPPLLDCVPVLGCSVVLGFRVCKTVPLLPGRSQLRFWRGLSWPRGGPPWLAILLI